MIALWHKKNCIRKPNRTWITQTVSTLKQSFYTHITEHRLFLLVQHRLFLRSPRIQCWTFLTFRASEYYFLINHFLIRKKRVLHILPININSLCGSLNTNSTWSYSKETSSKVWAPSIPFWQFSSLAFDVTSQRA